LLKIEQRQRIDAEATKPRKHGGGCRYRTRKGTELSIIRKKNSQQEIELKQLMNDKAQIEDQLKVSNEKFDQESSDSTPRFDQETESSTRHI
jgi:hypothetical protein